MIATGPGPLATPTWEQRWHPLREEWVIVAAHRQNRPWSGHTVTVPKPSVPGTVAGCYLCPGNARVSGQVNPPYDGVFVFDNDHPCVGPDAPLPAPPAAAGLRNSPARGLARVVCYTPRHDLSLAELPRASIVALLRTWQAQHIDLGSRADVNQVLAFENKGEVVGVSNPHPHGQIYATNFVWKTIETELAAGERHRAETGRVLFQDVTRAEREDGRRVIAENDGAIAFLPYFARYAYEIFIAPKATHPNIATLSEAELVAFADVLSQVLRRLDALWSLSFPYVLVLHQAPTDGREHRGFHFHIELHPPLRSPTLLKYLAGPEIGGGNFLADTCPEDKAAELRALVLPPAAP